VRETSKRFAKWFNRDLKSSSINTGFCLRFTENKALEIELAFQKDFWDWFRFCTQLNKKGSHAGFCMSIDLLWVNFTFQMYDKRQWDHKNNRFLDPEVPEPEFKYF
jgi:hypothetical protein